MILSQGRNKEMLNNNYLKGGAPHVGSKMEEELKSKVESWKINR